MPVAGTDWITPGSSKTNEKGPGTSPLTDFSMVTVALGVAVPGSLLTRVQVAAAPGATVSENVETSNGMASSKTVE